MDCWVDCTSSDTPPTPAPKKQPKRWIWGFIMKKVKVRNKWGMYHHVWHKQNLLGISTISYAYEQHTHHFTFNFLNFLFLDFDILWQPWMNVTYNIIGSDLSTLIIDTLRVYFSLFFSIVSLVQSRIFWRFMLSLCTYWQHATNELMLNYAGLCHGNNNITFMEHWD